MKKRKPRTLKTIIFIWLTLFLIAAAVGAYFVVTRFFQKTQINNNKQNNTQTHNPKDRITIGGWNTLNFMLNKKTTQIEDGKTDAIADIIQYINYDLIGLVEINKDINEQTKQFKYFLNKLNNGTNNSWSYSLSGNLNPSKNTLPAQIEQTLILYKTNLFELKKTFIYSNPKTKEDNLYYVRPPYGASFSYKLNPAITFGVVFDHFDSPGVSKYSPLRETQEQKSDASQQGTYEVHDAKSFVPMIKEMQNKLDTDNLFFMADTNIHTKNQAKVFNEQEIAANGFKFAFEDSDSYKSSLSSKFGQYVNPYDKIIYKFSSNFKLVAPEKAKDMHAIHPDSQGFIFDFQKSVNKKIVIRPKTDKSKTDYDWLRNKVSDHAPVGMSFIIN